MLWIDGSQPVRLLFADALSSPPQRLSDIISPADFEALSGWADLVVGSHPRWVQQGAATTIAFQVIARDPVPGELFSSDFDLAMIQKLDGGVLCSHACRARVVKLELEFVVAGAAGLMTFAVAGIHQLQDEVIASVSRRTAA